MIRPALGLVLGALIAAATAGCGSLERVPDCVSDTDVLAGAGEAALSCADAGAVIAYVELLAARDLAAADRRQVRQALVARHGADPTGLAVQLAAAVERGEALAGATGLDGAEARGEAVYAALAGAGPLGDRDDGLAAVIRRAVAPWETDAESRLVLTEMDIEGWIFYASLCREAQAGGPLRLSVADRVTVYKLVRERFLAAGRGEQVAMLAVGPYWADVQDRWKAAPAETQQAWIAVAPLPPPMTSTSLGYAEAILGGDVAAHVRVLHEQLGPLHLAAVR